jgi:hypothetical protein
VDGVAEPEDVYHRHQGRAVNSEASRFLTRATRAPTRYARCFGDLSKASRRRVASILSPRAWLSGLILDPPRAFLAAGDTVTASKTLSEAQRASPATTGRARKPSRPKRQPTANRCERLNGAEERSGRSSLPWGSAAWKILVRSDKESTGVGASMRWAASAGGAPWLTLARSL